MKSLDDFGPITSTQPNPSLFFSVVLSEGIGSSIHMWNVIILGDTTVKNDSSQMIVWYLKQSLPASVCLLAHSSVQRHARVSLD